MTEIIERVKQSPEFRQAVSRELAEFRNETIAGQAQTGAILLVSNRALQKASQVMAEEIYELTEETENLAIENKGLKTQLGTYLNDDQLRKYCKEEKLKLGTDTDRNQRILERLNKRITETDKQIKYSSTAANAGTYTPAALVGTDCSQPALARKK